MTYEMRECVLENVQPPNSHMAAYAPDGGYIGLEEDAKRLEDRGIQAQLISPEHRVCSIGFCEREQKWFGWSHRAIHGFAVGDSVKPGDCAYTDERGAWTAQTLDDAKQMAIDFADGVS